MSLRASLLLVPALFVVGCVGSPKQPEIVFKKGSYLRVLNFTEQPLDATVAGQSAAIGLVQGQSSAIRLISRSEKEVVLTSNGGKPWTTKWKGESEKFYSIVAYRDGNADVFTTITSEPRDGSSTKAAVVLVNLLSKDPLTMKANAAEVGPSVMAEASKPVEVSPGTLRLSLQWKGKAIEANETVEAGNGYSAYAFNGPDGPEIKVFNNHPKMQIGAASGTSPN